MSAIRGAIQAFAEELAELVVAGVVRDVRAALEGTPAAAPRQVRRPRRRRQPRRPRAGEDAATTETSASPTSFSARHGTLPRHALPTLTRAEVQAEASRINLLGRGQGGGAGAEDDDYDPELEAWG